MPIYEYEPLEGGCETCEGRYEVLQSVNEEPLTACPKCGMKIRRIVSRASFQLDSKVSPDKAAEKGFTTYKRSGKGHYERVAGDAGPSTISSDD